MDPFFLGLIVTGAAVELVSRRRFAATKAAGEQQAIAAAVAAYKRPTTGYEQAGCLCGGRRCAVTK